MKTTILTILLLLLTSCGSKHKVVQESSLITNTKIDSIGTQVAITKVDSSSEDCEWELEWQPDDSTTASQAVIIRPDGTKMIIPRGVLKGKKKYKRINGLYIKKDSSSVKKSTTSDTYQFKREKNVHRDHGLSGWYWLFIIAISLIILYKLVKKLKLLR